MASRVISDDRVRRLNTCEGRRGNFTLYWMQQSQRATCNHALEFAIQRVNHTGNRLLVCFALTDNYPDANLRHYAFMLQGLQKTAAALKRRGIPLAVHLGDPADVMLKLAKQATEVICDRGYLRHQREWRTRVADQAQRPVWQVESDVIVPVEVASEKSEYAARTIRPKLQKAAEDFRLK